MHTSKIVTVLAATCGCIVAGAAFGTSAQAATLTTPRAQAHPNVLVWEGTYPDLISCIGAGLTIEANVPGVLGYECVNDPGGDWDLYIDRP